MTALNFYKLLEINNTATSDEIKKQFHKLAKTHHPDRNPNDSENAATKMKEINEAYDTLGRFQQLYCLENCLQ